ncbi:hypothetical protein [Guptibacillus hwajinpoensis]|uniref:hypothetical protein n=1 Tax=Guptibacillus hwajinpoensis TaxID=208199 RepID=UPI00384B1B47
MTYKMIVLIVITGLLSACGFEQSPMTFVKKPAQAETRATLLKQIEEDFPDGEMLSPTIGREKQTISLKDLDGEEGEEAIAVIKMPDRNPALSLVVYQKNQDDWEILYEKQLNGDQLNDLIFEDVTNDGLLNLIVGISMGQEELNNLFIYKCTSEGFKQIFEKSYSIADVDNLNEDGKKQLFLLHSVRNIEAYLTSYQLDLGKDPVASKVELDPMIYFEKMKVGMVSPEQRGLIIDGSVGAHSGVSYVLTERNDKLVKLIDAYDPKAFKPYPLYSRDINKDGIIEIGNFYAPPGWEDEPMVAIPWIEVYYQWEGNDQYRTIQERYTDYGNGYIITMESEWSGNVTIEKPENGVIIRSVKTEKVLLEIRWSQPDEWKPGEDFAQLKKTDRYRYEIKRSTSQYKDNFSLLADDY